MASIYGPPAHKRRRRSPPAAATANLTAMQTFWLVIVMIVLMAVWVRLELDDGDPELDETMRRLEMIQRMNENYRPFDPVIFEIPKFEPPKLDPLIFEPLQTAELITAKPVPAVTQPLRPMLPAVRIPKSPRKTRRPAPRVAPEQ